MTLLQSAVINLELRQGLRHVEVIRLRHCDIDYETHLLTVIGKGPIGGKIRRIPMVPATEAALKVWQDLRDIWVQEGRERYPSSFTDPETVIVWRKAGRLYSYSEEGYGLDKVVTLPLNKQLDFHFSNHTLRRTFGRALYRADVPVATIAKILGHESTEVTLRYIGVDIDDMRNAMQKEIFA
jgi:integrase/recombinase XerD